MQLRAERVHRRVVDRDDRDRAVLLDLHDSAMQSPLSSYEAHANGAVEPDRLAVQELVLDDVPDERGEVLGPAEPLRERHLRLEARADVVAHRASIGVSKVRARS